MSINPFSTRLDSLLKTLRRRRLDAALVFGEANIRSLTGVVCDNACLLIRESVAKHHDFGRAGVPPPAAARDGTRALPGFANASRLPNLQSSNPPNLQPSKPQPVLLTDFRYAAAIRREAPWLKVGNLKRLKRLVGAFRRNAPTGAVSTGGRISPKCASGAVSTGGRISPKCASGAVSTGGRISPKCAALRIGCEFTESHERIEKLRKMCPRAKLVDISGNLSDLRAVKTAEEIGKIRAAERLTCEIWRDASAQFRAGMTELDMARIIRKMMIDRADGESFDTIVCIGANAAECHHVPDDTVWNGRDPILVDMGVKFGGYCGDLTRNVRPTRPSRAYREAYALVEKANRAAIAALKPGMTAGALDRVARRVIAEGGFGKCFGHSLGHGVGLAIHEAPTARKGAKTVLKPGMLVTIEPGIYLEGNLGVRIEDLALVTETGCEILSASATADGRGRGRQM